MENENSLVRVEAEDGKSYDMLILKEFDYKKKKYAVLMEMNTCHCGDDCGDECHCDDECDCGDDCHCDEEPMLCILEETKDSNGEIFKSIDDDKLFDEVVKEADKLLYE